MNFVQRGNTSLVYLRFKHFNPHSLLPWVVGSLVCTCWSCVEQFGDRQPAKHKAQPMAGWIVVENAAQELGLVAEELVIDSLEDHEGAVAEGHGG